MTAVGFSNEPRCDVNVGDSIICTRCSCLYQVVGVSDGPEVRARMLDDCEVRYMMQHAHVERLVRSVQRAALQGVR